MKCVDKELFRINHLQYKNIIEIDFHVFRSGKITCITGESGAGKSTFLKLLNAIYELDSGEIYFKGVSIKNWDPIQLRRDVMMVSQTPYIIDGSIEDNLQLGKFYLSKQKASKEEMTQVLQELSLEKELKENANNLSGGEKQRLALARVMLMNPSVYLLDEPTSAMDDETAMKVMKSFIHKAKSRKQTIIMITHSKMLEENLAEETFHLKKLEGRK